MIEVSIGCGGVQRMGPEPGLKVQGSLPGRGVP